MSILQEGQVIRQTYEVERLIGEGAFAEVYRVKHAFFGRQAMKVFKTTGMTVKETVDMLEEAIWLSRVGHPNIIRVFEANVTDASGSRGFFTMEHVAGGSLDQFWRSHGARFVPVETAVEIVRQVCRGLAVAHAERPPMIHRDVKPQNVLVGYDIGGLRAILSDFGLAKHVNPLTFRASARGTPAFKAPEAFRDPESDSPAGDVWGIGCTLYLLLTDRLPYSERELRDGKVSAAQLHLPSSLNLRSDPELDRIVLRALAFSPSDRYKTAIELLRDLDSWKPGSRGRREPKTESSGEITKSALGLYTSLDEREARRMAKQAFRLARQAGRLKEAADLMEEALNKWPDLRGEYEYRLTLWRNGIVT